MTPHFSVDRRLDVRRDINQDFVPLERVLTEYLSNVSRKGAFIRSEQPLDVGSRVTFRFTVVAEDLETLEGQGRVVRAVQPGSSKPAGMGVAFTALPAASRMLIDRLLVSPS